MWVTEYNIPQPIEPLDLLKLASDPKPIGSPFRRPDIPAVPRD